MLMEKMLAFYFLLKHAIYASRQSADEICAVKKYLNSREYFTIECFFCKSHEHAHTRRKVKRDTMESCGQ